MPGVQVVYHGPFILPLHSAPRAEQEAHLSFQRSIFPRDPLFWVIQGATLS